MSKKLKSIVALVIATIIFSTSCLVCFAANKPGFKVKYYDGIVVGIDCKILKDQDNTSGYLYDQSRVRVIEGNYDSGWKYSPKFSKSKSSVQVISNPCTKRNLLLETCYARYGLMK